jgi:choline dehydrogenase
LQTQHDVDILVRSIQILLRITQSGPLAQSVNPAGPKDSKFDHHLYGAKDAELEDFARKRAETLYHPTSTARMGKLEDGAVVDGRLKVYGVDGLRVVDASIFPT